jgi:hypothetical protein
LRFDLAGDYVAAQLRAKEVNVTPLDLFAVTGGAAITLIAGALASAGTVGLKRRWRRAGLGARPNGEEAETSAPFPDQGGNRFLKRHYSENFQQHVSKRLDEATELLQSQLRTAWLYAVASSLLTFGQFVVGAVLASSFVQQSLSKGLVGSLGLVVLLASAVRQRYRPDVRARSARQRAIHLRSLIRRAEDGLAALHLKVPGVHSLKIISDSLSQGITEIELSELAETDSTEKQSKTGEDTGEHQKGD